MKKFIKNKKFLFFFLACFIFLSMGFSARALELTYPTFIGRTLNDSSTIVDLIAYIYSFALAIGGIALFIMLIVGGFKYLTSMGNPGKMSETIKQITSSVLGLVLLLGSWLVLNTINPELVILKSPVTSPFSTSTISINLSALGITNGVVLWEDIDYGGGYYPLAEGEKTWDFRMVDPHDGTPMYVYKNSAKTLENSVSGVSLITENFALLCVDDYWNNCVYIDSDQSDLRKVIIDSNTNDSLNDKGTSAVAGRSITDSPCLLGGVVLFEGKDRKFDEGESKRSEFYEANAANIGQCIAVSSGHTNSPPGPVVVGDDHTKSFAISGRCRVTLYENEDCGGASISFAYATSSPSGGIADYACEPDYNCIKDLTTYPFPSAAAPTGNWIDKASSLRIEEMP